MYLKMITSFSTICPLFYILILFLQEVLPVVNKLNQVQNASGTQNVIEASGVVQVQVVVVEKKVQLTAQPSVTLSTSRPSTQPVTTTQPSTQSTLQTPIQAGAQTTVQLNVIPPTSMQIPIFDFSESLNCA